LLGEYPWGLTGEEFAPVEGADQDHRWLVDPIDGTTNFLFGQHYTITIALRRGNETICGLVYNPVSGEMFTTIKGKGAYLNGERLQVNASTDVAMMCVGTGLPTPNLQLYPGAYQRLDSIRAPIGAVRVVGSAANSCAYVACGRLTGYYEETGFVDTAAGILLVQEAGGIVTDWWGRGPEFYEKTGTLIVANPATHTYLMEHLRGVPLKNPA
jgi:myo-inositol-1(or 4)-monophosphatase